MSSVQWLFAIWKRNLSKVLYISFYLLFNMQNKQTKLIVTQTEIILEQCKKLQGKGTNILNTEGDVYYLYYLQQIDEVVDQFNSLIPKINNIFKKEELDEEFTEIVKIEATLQKIRVENIVYNADKKLLQLTFGSQKILSFLREGVELSEITKDRLNSLNTELENLKDKLNLDVYNNIKEAKDAFEKGSFLGSGLISGRVIRACLDKIKGKDITEKIQSLKDFNLLREKDGYDSILRASHFGRNLASHDLKIMPASSEALSFLADAIKIAKILSQYHILESTSKKIIPDKIEEPATKIDN